MPFGSIGCLFPHFSQIHTFLVKGLDSSVDVSFDEGSGFYEKKSVAADFGVIDV